MKAGIYKDVNNIKVEEIAKPELTDGSIIVKNIRSGICGTDLHAYYVEGKSVGILKNNEFGHEMAGIIDGVGKGVNFKKGTHVFVNPCTFKEQTEGVSIDMCCDMAGAFSEYIKVENPELGYNVFILPENLSWDVAALIEPLSVALNGILICNPDKNQKVVIYGGGIIGLCTLACLKYLGFNDVIVTARNPLRMSKVTEMGGVLCNTNETSVVDFVMDKWGESLGNNGETVWNADIVINCAGYKGAFEEILKYSKPGGYISVVALGRWELKVTEHDIVNKAVHIVGSFAYTPEMNKMVINMIADKPKLFEPLITATYGLSEIEEAFADANISSKNVKVLIDFEK